MIESHYSLYFKTMAIKDTFKVSSDKWLRQSVSLTTKNMINKKQITTMKYCYNTSQGKNYDCLKSFHI